MVRSRVFLALLSVSILVLGIPMVTSGDVYTSPGPFFSLGKGDAWFFNKGFIDCWAGSTPQPGCPQNVATLKVEGREYFVFGESSDAITTPHLRYVQFTAPDPLVPCDYSKGGCFGHAVACSAVRYQLLVDGKVVVATGSMAPSTSSGVLALKRDAIRSGKHTIRVRMLGNPTGCAGNAEDIDMGGGRWLKRSWGVALWLWTGPPTADLAGVVVDDSGIPVTNLEMLATGDKKTYTTMTDASGAYFFSLPADTYNVRPHTTPGGAAFEPAKRKVPLSDDVTEVNFVRRHDELELRTASTAPFEGVPWTRVQATGAVVNAGSARLTNARGEPRAGQSVTIDAPYWDGHPPGADPRVVICDAKWNRVYPGAGFERTTDDSGRVDFTTFFGSELGLWWLHGRETADVRAFGVLPVGQLGSIAGPDQRIIDTIQQSRKLGLPAAPLAGSSLSQVQAGLLEWLLAHWTYGPLGGSVAETGAFAPIRNASGTAAAIVFYPAGDPGPLRSHLEAGTPLPYPSYAFVIPFKHVALPFPSLTSPVKHIWYADFGGGTWSDASKEPPYGKSAMTLGQWEGTNGPARLGYAKARSNEGLAYLGYPYPPPLAPSRLRLRYEHCVPGAAPSLDVVEAYSPVRLRFTDRASGLPFGYDAKGKYVNLIGGFVERGKGKQPDRYVLPTGDYTVQITGTGRGRTTLVVTRGDRISTFEFAVRRGARGTLRLSGTAVPKSLRFSGQRVRADTGVRLALRVQPGKVRAKRYSTVGLRIRDQFGVPVERALVTIRGSGVKATLLTDARGRGAVKLWPAKRGRLRVTATSPGFTKAVRTVRVRG